MNKIIIASLLVIHISIFGFGRNQCDIINNYEDFISVERASYKDGFYLMKEVVEIEEERCFSNLINNNVLFVGYLLTHFSSQENSSTLLEITDSITLRNNYFTDLKKKTVCLIP